MLTRRSRKEGVASPSDADTSSKSTKSKRSATPSKNKKPVTPRRRSKSRSVDRGIRTRSRSANKSVRVPQIVLERYETEKEIVKKKEIKGKIV